MNILLAILLTVSIAGWATGQLVEVAEQAEKQATEAMQKHNARTQAINDFIKHGGYNHADTDNH